MRLGGRLSIMSVGALNDFIVKRGLTLPDFGQGFLFGEESI
jgi:hypothetical protein